MAQCYEKRSVQFSDFSDTTDADIDRWSIGAAIKTGLDLKVSDNIRLEPFAQLAGFVIHSPSYKEKSHDIAALNIKETQLRSLEARLGLTLEAATFTPTTAYWQLQALYGRELLSRAGDMKASFVVSDLRGSFDRSISWNSKDRWTVGFKAGIENREGLSLNVRFDGQWESADTHSVAGGIEAAWRF